MSFRDSISRFKRNLEKKLHIGSRDASPTPSSASLPPVSVYAPLGSSGLSTPGQVALNIPAAPENTDRPSTSTSKTNDHSGTGSVALTGTLHTISDDGNPTSSRMPEVSTDSQPGVVDVPLAVDNTLKTPGGEDNDNQPADHSLAKDNKRDGTTGLVWTGAKLLLQVVNASADVFPPLKSAVGGLNECINIYERAKKGRKDYGHQLNKINELLEELQGYMEGREAMEMTQSVKRVCCELDLEVNNLKAKLEGPAAKQWLKAVDAPAEITECQDRIQRLLERLTLNATMNTLKKLNMQDEKMEKQAAEIKKQGMERRLKEMLPTLSSIYNSAESDDIKRGGCTQGTRQLQIHSLLEWALDPSTGRTCWMNGMAGTGKTTIAYSICSALEERSALGASFFCSRSIPECRQVKHIIPTIAYQLARYSLPFRCALDKVLESNPDARTQALKIQYEKLIVKPLSEVRDSLPTDFIVVIDALDECENESSLGLILDLLISPDFTLPIRFLVSSRPEPEIWERMANSARLVLHELDSSSVETDIERFMKHELRRIPLTDAQWLALLKRCGVLFIFASTACRYIEQENKMGTLDEAVGAVVRSGSGKTQSTDKNSIDELYSTILAAAYQESRMSRENRERMRNVLETVICAGEPMTLSTLVELIGLKNIKQAEALLQPLRSVVNITATTGLVTTLHASFPDYMLSLSRSAGFHCVAPTRHLTLTKACLRTIDLLEPKFNICKLTSSYVSDDKVNNLDDRVKKAISPGLAYACRYWSTHLNLGEHEGQLVEAIDRFFTQRLLVWMEVLNLMKLMRFATSIIRDAEKWCSEREILDGVAQFARDASHFVSVYATNPICQSTPHIYVSMLPFWPRSQPISLTYMLRTVKTIEPKGLAIVERQTVLLATWRVSSAKVQSISLSADGTRIAADTDDAIDLFDTSTGEGLLHVQEAQTKGVRAVAISPDGAQITFGSAGGAYLLDVGTRQITELHPEKISGVWSVVFSPNGSHVAIGSQDCEAYICSGKGVDPFVHTLEGHSAYVSSFTFSPDGRHVASGSGDTSIRIWDIKTGQMVGNPLQGHTVDVLSIAYSPDGSRLASSSVDVTIRVWDPQTGQTVLGPLEGHSNWVRSVTFSPDGSFIASGSDDRTIRLYDTTTGQTILGPLQGHTNRVNSVIVTPDSARLFSCSDDGTIRLWNVQDRHVPDKSHPTVPSASDCVRYSPDRLQVVSGSMNGTVCVWDVQTGDMVLGPLEGHTQAVCAVDYSPNGAYIASASWDCTLRIWSAQDGKDLHGPIQGHTRDVICVRFSPDSSLLVSGSFDSTVRIWDAQTGQQVNQPLQGHSGWVRSVAFSPNGSHVVSGSYDGTIRVWDIQTGQTVIDPLRGHESEVMSAEFSPDGSRILSGSWDKSMRMWDAVTGQTLLAFGKGHGEINSVGLSPDGGLVVSGSADGTVCIWDAQSGDLMLTLQGHTEWVRSVQFSPDGSHVVSCSLDGTIRFWDVSSCQAYLQDHTMRDGGKNNEYSQIEAACKPWTLRDNGWVVDRRDRRLVWVPSDLQPHLLPHSNDFVIPKARGFRVNFSGVNVGDQWTKCYQS